MIITTHAHPRAALIGNPSDGYNGKTIAFLFDDYDVQVQLYESPELEILPAERDHSRFSSLKELVEDVSSFGYYGGVRLIKATLKKFYKERGRVRRETVLGQRTGGIEGLLFRGHLGHQRIVEVEQNDSRLHWSVHKGGEGKVAKRLFYRPLRGLANDPGRVVGGVAM